jgi:predicted  nucleic acid-binding Zn-ribbon protein
MSFYQHIYDANDITLAIEKLIDIEKQRIEQELDDEHEEELNDLKDELQEARQLISELQTRIVELESERE